MRNTLRVRKLNNNPKKEKELQKKLNDLSEEYLGTPMLFMQDVELKMVDQEGMPLLYFPDGGNKSSHFIITRCRLIGDKI